MRQYAENRSEPAFTELVSRHINLVYAVAFRVVGRDRHLAQDVVQTVFTDWSVRAKSLQGIEETMTKMRAANPNSDPEREFFDQKLKVLAQVLSPEELEEFRMRKSPRAQWLSGDVRYFNCTREEFKALLDAREEFLRPDPKDHLSVDGATAIEEVRTLLGDQRALEYERVSDYGYSNGRMAAERIGLPEDLANQAGQIVFEARMAAAETARNTNLPVAERRLEIQRI